MYDSYEINKYRREENYIDKKDTMEWNWEKAQFKEILNQLQKLSFQMGAPILLSVHPDGNKCAAIYNQTEQLTEVEDRCCFLKIKLPPNKKEQ